MALRRLGASPEGFSQGNARFALYPGPGLGTKNPSTPLSPRSLSPAGLPDMLVQLFHRTGVSRDIAGWGRPPSPWLEVPQSAASKTG